MKADGYEKWDAIGDLHNRQIAARKEIGKE